MPLPLLDALQPDTIAVFRALQLGDMMCAVPALRALRAARPRARITLVGLPWARTFAGRFARYVDDFIPFPGAPGLPERTPDAEAYPDFLARMRNRRFELVIQLHGDGRITNGLVAGFGAEALAGFGDAPEDCRGAFLPYPDHGPEIRRLLALTSLIGAPPQGEELEFPLTYSDYAELASNGLARDLHPQGYICLHPGARAVERRWPTEHFAAVADALHDDTGLPIVLTGSEQESELAAAVAAKTRAPTVEAAVRMSYGALAVLLAGARLLVCNDTGVAHVAAALRLPSVIVFRSAELERWGPLDQTLHRVVTVPAGEPAGDETVQAVLAQARDLLAATAPETSEPEAAG